ncbi:TIGR02269 family lipoprotein [Pyxidicoccus trucidator]|uniref:TIGR02269 family lipoprotein n=1 Tax=Pyxidicoccus trucidator TaxID=2709662 RepID=UPI001F079BCD|nr:TIGR02269 family lipoprotein [Pyxidicoccus trucidator]
MEDSTGSVADALSKLAARPPGLGNRGLSGVNGAFTRYLDHGTHQLPWLHGALGSATTVAEAASGVADPDMELGILRMTGPRLQAAMFGGMLLAAWLDFLQLTDVVLRECPAYSVETLVMDMSRVQRLMEPALVALASQDPERVEAAATAMPGLMGQLTREFGSIRDGARTAMEKRGKLMAAMQLVEMLTLVSTLRMSLPRLPPAAPATVGVGLVMGSGGVMAGSRIVVSAGWVEMIRRLVKAGVISMPVVSAAVRIHGGQVLMAQAHGDLPQGVRDALGDGPEVRGMHETGRAGAGMSEHPQHHVLPREHREWFEKRGFTGDMDIDKFCVRLELAHHQAIHGGGDWRLGRMWPNEWNRMLMRVLSNAEREAGRMLTRNDVLNIVADRMKRYDIPMNFTAWRGR